jgi:hypothetical protein
LLEPSVICGAARRNAALLRVDLILFCRRMREVAAVQHANKRNSDQMQGVALFASDCTLRPCSKCPVLLFCGDSQIATISKAYATGLHSAGAAACLSMGYLHGRLPAVAECVLPGRRRQDERRARQREELHVTT